MTKGTWLIVIGLSLNTVASIFVVIPYLLKHNVEDDFITEMDKSTGNFKQRRHIKEHRFGLLGFVLFAAGFALQIIGIVIEAHT